MKAWVCGLALWSALGVAEAGEADGRYFPVSEPLSAAAAPSDLAALPEGEEPVYPALVYAGARQLNLSLAFVHAAREGLGLLYARKYKETRRYFAEMEAVYPGTAVASIGDLLVWQAVMLENFDFRHDAQYQASSRIARTKLEASLKVPGAESWEHFMMAGVTGIEAIHAARQNKYLPALSMAFDAIDHVESVRKVAPDFTDLALADGLYNYWRTIITRRSKALPDFGDHREEGIVQMQKVEQDGIFLQAPATLSMSFTWIEENQLDKAFETCMRNHARYPNNVISELMLGITQLYLRKYPDALVTFDHILELSPQNKRVLYYRGLALFRSGNLPAAKKVFEAYLAVDYMEDYQRGAAHYRLGQVLYRQEHYAEAEAAYKAAIKASGHKSAKAALDRMKQAKREERITW